MTIGGRWARTAILAMLPGLAIAAEGPRVGVVVIGPDSAAVAAAQKSIEAKIAQAPATVRGEELLALMVAPSAGTANAWASDPSARAAFEAALSEAKKSYFSDLMPAANAKLDEAAAVLDRSIDVPGTIRVKVPLWRAAVALRQGQKDTAASEVNIALLLVPNLELEPNSPPPVVQLLAEVRKQQPKPVKVVLTGVPSNAVVKIDDVVLAPAALAVLPGSHVLDVIAPGFRPFNAEFTAAKADVAIPVVLVPSMSASWEKLFEGAVARGSLADVDRKSLDPVVAREKLDALVIAQVKPGEVAGLVWRRAEGTSQAGSGADAAAFAAWAAPLAAPKAAVTVAPTPAPAATATPAPTVVAIATPRPAATPAPTPRARRAPGASALSVEAGLAVARWTRTVEPEEGAGYEVPGLSGAGPRVRVLGGRTRGPVGALDVSFVSFGNMTIEDRDGEDAVVPGGTLLQARAGAGWRIRLGDDERAISITPTIGGFYESHSAQDVENEIVFPSHTRTGADVRVLAHVPVGPAGLLVELGVAPFSTWTEDPANTTGRDPAPGVAPSFRAGLDLPAGARGRIAFDAAAESRSVAYSGEGGSTLTPVDARRAELLTTLGVSFRYRF